MTEPRGETGACESESRTCPVAQPAHFQHLLEENEAVCPYKRLFIAALATKTPKVHQQMDGGPVCDTSTQRDTTRQLREPTSDTCSTLGNLNQSRWAETADMDQGALLCVKSQQTESSVAREEGQDGRAGRPWAHGVPQLRTGQLCLSLT